MTPLLLAALSFAPAQAALCQSVFFSTFGDNTQVDNGPGSVDDAAAPLYAMPANFLQIASQQWGNGMARTDQIVVDAAHPIVLQGYSPFDYEQTTSAFLRFDIYWSTYSNTEALSFLDDDITQFLTMFSYYDRLTERLRKFDVNNGMWISIRLDLLTGDAFASSIDAYGNPLVDFGQFATFGGDPLDQGQLYYILKLASDGDLYAELYDDMPLSYVALYGSWDGTICPCAGLPAARAGISGHHATLVDQERADGLPLDPACRGREDRLDRHPKPHGPPQHVGDVRG